MKAKTVKLANYDNDEKDTQKGNTNDAVNTATRIKLIVK